MKTYYIEQKLSLVENTYYIYDLNNNLYLKVRSNGVVAFLDDLFGSVLSIGHKLYIKKLDGSEYTTLKKRFGVISSKYVIDIGNEEIAVINQHIESFKPKIDIITKEDKYTVIGDIMGRDFIVSNNGVTLARIKKVPFKIKDRYKVDIFDDKNESLFLSTVIVIDNSMHN